MRKSEKLLTVGMLVAAVLLVAYVVWTAIARTLRLDRAEGFAGHVINHTTECPPGAKMYMYGGAPYCCDSIINTDAASVQGTCRSASSAPNAPAPLFCSLGPTANGVINCMETRTGLFEALGEDKCPPSMPNYVMVDASNQKCCAGPGNAGLTDCVDTNTATQCRLSNDQYWLTDNTSCQYQRLFQEHGSCPAPAKQFTMNDQITKDGRTLAVSVFGCTDDKGNCISKALSKRLDEMFGPGTSAAFTVCSAAPPKQ